MSAHFVYPAHSPPEEKGNKMTTVDTIDPEFYKLLNQSEQLLALIKSKRESGSAGWQEIRRLNNELEQIADKMSALLPDIPRTSSFV
jgi:uncharacterized protein YdcH (DUF465 family)